MSKPTTPTQWQTIFALSYINGADNHQHLLPVNGWDWPNETWLRRRMARLNDDRFYRRYEAMQTMEQGKRRQG